MHRGLTSQLPMRTLARSIAPRCQNALSQQRTRSISGQSTDPTTTATTKNEASSESGPKATGRSFASRLSASLAAVKSTSTPNISDQALSSYKLQASKNKAGETLGKSVDAEEPYHFHIYSHKHNTHVTVTTPGRDAIVSMSTGNLGFRKSSRKHYDSAYQLGALVIDKLQQKGMQNKINRLEVVLRGFGAGREAVTKVLMGNEGRLFRPKIVSVADSTRLKFGGTRSQKPRRLG